MVYQTLPAEKMNKKLSKIFFCFSLASQVSRKFAAAKNGQVSSKFAAAKNGQVSSQTKTKKIFDIFFFIFSAGRVWYTITPQNCCSEERSGSQQICC